MKKRAMILLLTTAMSSGMVQKTPAVEFKTKGVWINMLEYGDGGNFVKQGRDGRNTSGWGRWGEDEMEAKTRVRLQLDAVASESLSGTVYFEIGAVTWGRASKGGALGTDGTDVIKIKHAYLDWVIPHTEIKTRMGLQRIALPDYASEASQVFDGDMAGVTVSMPLSKNVGLTAFWARPFNDNWAGSPSTSASLLDNVDMFSLLLPLTFEGVRVTPWAMLGMVGQNAFRSAHSAGGASDYYGNGYAGDMAPAVYALRNGRSSTHTGAAYATALWGGLTGEMTAIDPFRLAWSFNYGHMDTGEKALNRSGWYAALLAEYKMDWGTPGIYGWYSSGDDSNVKNGSERLPALDYNDESTSGFSGFGALGTWTIGRDAVLGYTLAGTWGLGARVKDVSFIDKLSHTLRVNLYNGTNAASMARHIKNGAVADHSLYSPTGGTDFYNVNANGIYLTEKDYAAEFGLMTSYQIYDNLRLLVEANYIALWLDQSKSVWGGYQKNDQWISANSIEDCWNVNVSFIYKF